MRRTKTKAETTHRDLAELDAVLARIGELRRELERRQAALNDAIAEIRACYQREAEPAIAELGVAEEMLEEWCEVMREELTDGGKRKFCDLPSGRVGWRMQPPKVSIRNLPQTLAAIKALGATQFLRIEESIDKEAMLADPEQAAKIPGVKIKSEGEKFYAEPRAEALGGAEASR
jgi:phage host-nuclease inhibitor protein Gam